MAMRAHHSRHTNILNRSSSHRTLFLIKLGSDLMYHPPLLLLLLTPLRTKHHNSGRSQRRLLSPSLQGSHRVSSRQHRCLHSRLHHMCRRIIHPTRNLLGQRPCHNIYYRSLSVPQAQELGVHIPSSRTSQLRKPLLSTVRLAAVLGGRQLNRHRLLQGPVSAN